MDNLSVIEKRLPAHERVALAMKLAGVSITVTSITNMFAFLIGATSVSMRQANHVLNIFLNLVIFNLKIEKYYLLIS